MPSAVTSAASAPDRRRNSSTSRLAAPGCRSTRQAAQIRQWFGPLFLVSMVDFDLVPVAVANYQKLRRRGITPGTVDMIIGTYCIETGTELLTADLDFEPMRDHLGLRLTPA